DLVNALRKIRIDLNIPIEFDDSLKLLQAKQTRFAVATIPYSALYEKRKDGSLLYLKPILLGNEPLDIKEYQATNKAFPHQRTSDQWFSEAQTESYRMLGVHSVNEICGDWDCRRGLSGLLHY